MNLVSFWVFFRVKLDRKCLHVFGVAGELTAASRQRPGGWCRRWAAPPPWGSEAWSPVQHWGYWLLRHWPGWLSYWIRETHSYYQKALPQNNFIFKLEWALGGAHTFAYHKIGHWIMNILALVECQLDKNWPCYGKKKVLTFPWPWPLTRLIPKSNQMVPG